SEKYVGDIRVVSHEIAHALTYADIKKYVDDRKESTYNDKLKGAIKDSKAPQHIKALIGVYLNSAQKLGTESLIGLTQETISLSDVAQSYGELSFTQYAYINLHEFMALAMSTEQFQNALSNVTYQGTNL